MSDVLHFIRQRYITILYRRRQVSACVSENVLRPPGTKDVNATAQKLVQDTISAANHERQKKKGPLINDSRQEMC